MIASIEHVRETIPFPRMLVETMNVISPLFFYSIIVILGLVVVLIGRTLNTHDEEEWKGVYWWREMILGPPGYHRASAILGGCFMIIVGIIGFFYELFSS